MFRKRDRTSMKQTFNKWSKKEVKIKNKPSNKLCELKMTFWAKAREARGEQSAQQTPQNQHDTYTQPTKSNTHPSKVPSKGDFKGWLQKVSEEA